MTHINSVAAGNVDGDADAEVVTGGYYNDGSGDCAQLVVWNGANLACECDQSWYWIGGTRINSVAVGGIPFYRLKIATDGSYFDGTDGVAQLMVWRIT